MNTDYLRQCDLVGVVGKQCNPPLVNEGLKVISHNASVVGAGQVMQSEES